MQPTNEGAPFWQYFYELLLVFMFSTYGGVAQALMNNNFARKKPSTVLMLLVATCIVASFAGLMGWLLAKEMAWSPYMTYMISGLAGYSGGKFLEQLQVKFLQKVGKADDSST